MCLAREGLNNVTSHLLRKRQSASCTHPGSVNDLQPATAGGESSCAEATLYIVLREDFVGRKMCQRFRFRESKFLLHRSSICLSSLSPESYISSIVGFKKSRSCYYGAHIVSCGRRIGLTDLWKFSRHKYYFFSPSSLEDECTHHWYLETAVYHI
jgi:hypothetical protein